MNEQLKNLLMRVCMLVSWVYWFCIYAFVIAGSLLAGHMFADVVRRDSIWWGW
jgi:hypothetical protein